MRVSAITHQIQRLLPATAGHLRWPALRIQPVLRAVLIFAPSGERVGSSTMLPRCHARLYPWPSGSPICVLSEVNIDKYLRVARAAVAHAFPTCRTSRFTSPMPRCDLAALPRDDVTAGLSRGAAGDGARPALAMPCHSRSKVRRRVSGEHDWETVAQLMKRSATSRAAAAVRRGTQLPCELWKHQRWDTARILISHPRPRSGVRPIPRLRFGLLRRRVRAVV
jgi:hypothetical protein